MTQREKMLTGHLSGGMDNPDPDPTIGHDYMRAKDLCHKFNLMLPSDFKSKNELLHELLGKMGEHTFVLGPFTCDYGYNIEFGKGCFVNHGTVILDCAKVIFGDSVLIGPNCGFHTAAHPIDRELRDKRYEYSLPIRVGDSVWFGAGVQVLPGVTIGSNVVIGAGSIVNKDIPDNCVAAGNPCRVIRPITPEDKAKDLARGISLEEALRGSEVGMHVPSYDGPVDDPYADID